MQYWILEHLLYITNSTDSGEHHLWIIRIMVMLMLQCRFLFIYFFYNLLCSLWGTKVASPFLYWTLTLRDRLAWECVASPWSRFQDIMRIWTWVYQILVWWSSHYTIQDFIFMLLENLLDIFRGQPMAEFQVNLIWLVA